MDTDRILIQALRRTEGEFRKDEIAYLALTSKFENPFRDRLAFHLHETLRDDGFLVARELSRVDIGVLGPDGLPAFLIELKSMYTFDAIKRPAKFTDWTAADELKAGKIKGVNANTAVYSLLLATHPSAPIGRHLATVLKYVNGINGAFRTEKDATAVREKAVQETNQLLAGRNIVVCDAIKGGTAFGLDVELLYWLVRSSARETGLSALPSTSS